MKKNFPAIAAQIVLLQTCLNGDFGTRTLKENKQLLIDLEELQTITFDLRQRHGNPNYNEVQIEKELIEISVQLRTVIADQMFARSNGAVPLEILLNEFKYVSCLDHQFLYYSVLQRQPTKGEAANRCKNHIGDLILALCKTGLEKEKSNRKQKELFLNYLKEIRGSYNPSAVFYGAIEKVIALHEDERIVH